MFVLLIKLLYVFAIPSGVLSGCEADDGMKYWWITNGYKNLPIDPIHYQTAIDQAGKFQNVLPRNLKPGNVKTTRKLKNDMEPSRIDISNPPNDVFNPEFLPNLFDGNQLTPNQRIGSSLDFADPNYWFSENDEKPNSQSRLNRSLLSSILPSWLTGIEETPKEEFPYDKKGIGSGVNPPLMMINENYPNFVFGIPKNYTQSQPGRPDLWWLLSNSRCPVVRKILQKNYPNKIPPPVQFTSNAPFINQYPPNLIENTLPKLSRPINSRNQNKLDNLIKYTISQSVSPSRPFNIQSYRPHQFSKVTPQSQFFPLDPPYTPELFPMPSPFDPTILKAQPQYNPQLSIRPPYDPQLSIQPPYDPQLLPFQYTRNLPKNNRFDLSGRSANNRFPPKNSRKMNQIPFMMTPYIPNEPTDMFRSFPDVFSSSSDECDDNKENYRHNPGTKTRIEVDDQIVSPINVPNEWTDADMKQAEEIYLNDEKCGMVFNDNGEAVSDRIFGGGNVTLGLFPWIARIGYMVNQTVQFRCGGTLITPLHVITAAHCIVFVSSEVTLVRLGEHDDRSEIDCIDGVCANPVQDLELWKVYFHAKYKSNDVQNDIAIIILQTPAEITKWVSTICIPHEPKGMEKVGLQVAVAGWGYYNEKSKPSSVLRAVNLPIVQIDTCKKKFKANIDDSQLCIGGVDGEDSCNGDSGGPLMRINDDKVPKWQLLGLVSFGAIDCGNKNVPAVYTRVSKYHRWITYVVSIKYPPRYYK